MLLIAQEGLHIYQFSHPETVANQCSLCLHIYCLSLQVNNNCTDMIKYSPILKGFSRLWDLFACCVSEVKIGAWPEDQGKRYAKTHQTTLILTYLAAVLLNLQLSRTGLALTQFNPVVLKNNGLRINDTSDGVNDCLSYLAWIPLTAFQRRLGMIDPFSAGLQWLCDQVQKPKNSRLFWLFL